MFWNFLKVLTQFFCCIYIKNRIVFLTMDDELIIKRKLTFDGEGLGDERRLNLLQKMIARWISKHNSYEENENSFNRICSQISAVEYARRKSELVQKTYQKESMKYQQYMNEFEGNISNIKSAIECSKALLLEVKNLKQQKLKYDILARDISIEPSRDETSECVKELQNKLTMMKTAENQLNAEWSVWRKHCSLIVTTANELNSIIEKSQFK